MKRSFTILLGAGWWTILFTTQGLAANLSPTNYTVLSGRLAWGQITTPLCDQMTGDLDALWEQDGECLRFVPSTGEDTVKVELAFQTTAAPGPFELWLVSDGAWHEVLVKNWTTGDWDDLPMITAAGTSVSSAADADYVDPSSGTIMVTISTYGAGPARDDKTLDEVEIIIPPPP